jgi:sporulation protein YlmC with PRC-barrel domain
MEPRGTTSLVKLSDSDQILADPAEDIRGRDVRDRDGEDLGKVDDLLIDTAEHKVRFLRIEHGGVLGLGATPSFVPVDAITRISGDTVHLSESRERVTGAPRYDPDVIDGSDLYDSLYGYYGRPRS